MLVQGCSLDLLTLFQPELEVSSQGWTCPMLGKGSKANENQIHFKLSKQ